jgi:cytolysin-activating lysine-acyltransferase
MQYGNLIITAPALNAPGHSEAEIFGSIVWLAMQANNKNRLPLQDLSQWLLPALRSQQFILANENIDGQTRPVAYMSWANLTPEVESRYVDNPDEGLRPQEWSGGDRMWVIDWMTPFGHSQSFRRAVGAALTGYINIYCDKTIDEINWLNLVGQKIRDRGWIDMNDSHRIFCNPKTGVNLLLIPKGANSFGDRGISMRFPDGYCSKYRPDPYQSLSSAEQQNQTPKNE